MSGKICPLINCLASDFDTLSGTGIEDLLKLQDIENELSVQVSMKHEIELAMKLLEKDIHEKQDTLISLRQQLEEVKAINIEMYQKLQGSEDGLKEKNEIIARLEEKTNKITTAMKQLEQRYSTVTTSFFLSPPHSFFFFVNSDTCHRNH